MSIKKQTAAAVAFSVTFTLAAYLFFRFSYPYHIHYQEQFQLFEFTADYFLSVCGVPGGPADYLGRFLVQFFYYAGMGSFICAILISATQLLTYLSTGRRGLLHYSICFVPAALTWMSFCDENLLPGSSVAVLLALGLALLCEKLGNGRVREAVRLIFIPLAYFICGPLSVIYLVVAFRDARPARILAAAVLFALCPLLSSLLFHYTLGRLLTGVHYHRYHNVFPLWLWVAAGAVVLIDIAGKFVGRGKSEGLWKRGGGLIGGACAFALVGALAFVGVSRLADSEKEEIMKYDFLTSKGMWNRTMTAAEKKSPSQPISVSCLNLALAVSGRMPSHMFEFYQNGPQGLLPTFNRESTTAMSTSDIYYRLGMVNTAQRFAFEAQEAIPDYQKSARCYGILARTNIINGDYGVAAKYLESLKHTIYYSKWARETEKLLGDEAAIGADPEYSKYRSLRFKEHDFLFSDKEMDSMLGLLYLENRDNVLAASYLLAWSLLNKDLPRFKQCLSLMSFPALPRHYQEALVLEWAVSGQNGPLPPFIDRSISERFRAFITDQKANRDLNYMQARYGDSYWFYYVNRFN